MNVKVDLYSFMAQFDSLAHEAMGDPYYHSLDENYNHTPWEIVPSRERIAMIAQLIRMKIADETLSTTDYDDKLIILDELLKRYTPAFNKMSALATRCLTYGNAGAKRNPVPEVYSLLKEAEAMSKANSMYLVAIIESNDKSLVEPLMKNLSNHVETVAAILTLHSQVDYLSLIIDGLYSELSSCEAYSLMYDLI